MPGGSNLETDVYLGLDGRAALVTAGASTAGQAVARWLARAGCDVAVVDADGAAAERVAEDLRALDFTAIAVAAAGTSDSAIDTMVERVIAQFDALDVAVNLPPWTEGSAGREARFPGRTAAAALERLRICCLAEARAIAAGGEGGVVLNLDPAALSTAPRAAAPEEDVVRITRALALELADRAIRVNAVLGPSGLGSGPAAAERAGLASQSPLGRAIDADDLARGVVFLASDLARGVTGQILRVDGGWSLGPVRRALC